MKQEHEMTPGVLVSGEVLSAGDARARVAVLEAENAELRKRVCVPEGYVVVPEKKKTGAWESARIGDFNSGWNACRDSVVPLLERAAWMELDTTKRSLAIQDEMRAMLAASPAPVERLATDGGRNQRFEGLFEGETPDQRDARLASAAPVERNQCDGCQAGIPVESGMHRMGKPGGYADLMACTADRYTTPQPAPTAAPANCSEDAINSAIQVAFELGGLEDGSYHLEDDQLTEVLACAVYHSAPTAAQDVAGLVDALELALEYWRDRQQRYKNRKPRWVVDAESALAAHQQREVE